MSEYIYEHVQSGADHMGKQVELPTLVQREEIVRRRDCEYYTMEHPTGGATPSRIVWQLASWPMVRCSRLMRIVFARGENEKR